MRTDPRMSPIPHRICALSYSINPFCRIAKMLRLFLLCLFWSAMIATAFPCPDLLPRHHHAAAVAARVRPTLRVATRTSAERTIIEALLFQHQVATPRLSTFLHSTAQEDSSDTASTEQNKFDVGAVVKYATSIVIQMGLVLGLLTGFDWLVSKYSLQIPFAANVGLFYFLALKSRIFNPLANPRPDPGTLEAAGNERSEPVPKRKMPSWTPPGAVFPIVWLLIIGPIRAVSSALVYETAGSYQTTWPLMLHLSIGDVWNTINNVERRYGTSVTGVLAVWMSKAYAAYRYYQVNSAAGKLLALPLIWLTVASSLIVATWRLNPDPDTDKLEPLYPVTGKTETKFAWF